MINHLTEAAEKLVFALKEKNLKISFAESCTGGLLSAVLTDISGCSAVLSESYVTYSENAKAKILGVEYSVIKKYSVVSEEVSLQMAKGLFKTSGSDINISVTGVAGPNSDDYNNPVGLVYIGICTKNGTCASKFTFSGTREQIRFSACDEAYKMALSAAEQL